MYLQLSQGFHELLLYIIPPDSSKLKTKEPFKKCHQQGECEGLVKLENTYKVYGFSE